MSKHVALAFILCSFSLFAQEDLVRNWTKALCAPEMHGRGYVYGGDSIAAQYLVQEYTKLGLTPVPGQSSMLQSFQFSVNSFPGRMLLMLGDQEMKTGKDYIVDCASGSYKGDLKTYSLSKDNIFSIYTTEALQKKLASNELNALIINLKGIGGDSLKWIKGKLTEWKDVLPIVELFDKKFTWSVSQTANKFPYIYLRDSVYSGQKITLGIENQFIPKHKANNVVAYLPAKKATNKTIYFTAHYDHLGRMGLDTYFPGGNDNASGTALLLSLAKYFKSFPSEYNIVFIGFAGEEAGLLGSKYYVEHPLTNLKDIKFLINLDIMGSGEEGITIVNATLFPKAFKTFTKINQKKKLLHAVNKRGPAANSDHYFFTQAGVPAVFIYTQGPNKHYHDIFDTYEDLSFAEYEDLVTLLKEFVKKI
jgi:aminopeptidase YwaD